jgi:glycolate oxidase iron-sulfur subunit
LLDAGRAEVERRVNRPWWERLMRWALLTSIPHPKLYVALVNLLRAARPGLPGFVQRHIPTAAPRLAGKNPVKPGPRQQRRVLLLEGCAQSVLTPEVNNAAERLLGALGIAAIPVSGCCGALSQHLSAEQTARATMRANIDRWGWAVEEDVEAIVSTASGCGVTLKEYGHYLRDDPVYAVKAQRLASKVRDIGELVAAASDQQLQALRPAVTPIALQAPCTLQHGQHLGTGLEALLQRLGFALTPVADAHLCCGSAGTYSILQPRLAKRLRRDKIQRLLAGSPAVIATANVGCQLHLRHASPVPVRHWVELLDTTHAGETGTARC